MQREYKILYTASAPAKKVTDDLAVALGRLDAAAVKAQGQVKLVGTGNRGLGQVATRAEKARKSLDELGASAGKARQAIEAMGGKFQVAGGHVDGLAASFGKWVTGAAALATVKGALDAVAAGTRDARDYARETADEVLKIYESLRELRSLQGAPTTQDVAPGIVKASVTTGLSIAEMADLAAGFEGSAPAGVAKGNVPVAIGPDGKPTVAPEFKQGLFEGSAKLALAAGVDPKVMGDVAGLAGQLQRFETADQALAQLEAMRVGLDRGMADDSGMGGLVRAVVKLGGTMVDEGNGGAIQDIAEMGVAVGVASNKTPGVRSANTLNQAIRATRRFGDKTGETMEEFGITPGDSFREALGKFKAGFERLGVAEAQIPLAMQERGWGSDEERQSLLYMMKNIAVYDANLAEARETVAGGGAKVMATLDANAAGDRAVQNRKADAENAASQFLAGRSGEAARVARSRAEARLRNPDQPGGARIDTVGTNNTDRLIDYTVGWASQWFGDPGSRENRLREEMIQGLYRGADAAGVGEEARGRFRFMSGDDLGPNFERKFGEAAAFVESKGGDFTGGADKVVDAINRLNATVERRLGGPGGPGRPALPPANPPGAAQPGRL